MWSRKEREVEREIAKQTQFFEMFAKGVAAQLDLDPEGQPLAGLTSVAKISPLESTGSRE